MGSNRSFPPCNSLRIQHQGKTVVPPTNCCNRAKTYNMGCGISFNEGRHGFGRQLSSSSSGAVFFVVDPSETPQERLKVSEGSTTKNTWTPRWTPPPAHFTLSQQYLRRLVSDNLSQTPQERLKVCERLSDTNRRGRQVLRIVAIYRSIYDRAKEPVVNRTAVNSTRINPVFPQC